MDRPYPAARAESTSTAICCFTPPDMVTWATPSTRSRAGTTVSSARACTWVRLSPIRPITAVGSRSLMLMFTITGSMAPSGRESISNFSRSLVAAMSRSVPST